MTIKVGLVITLSIFIGVMYSLKRGFDVINYVISHKEIKPTIVSGKREDKYKDLYIAEDSNKDLEKTLELNFR